MRILKCTLVASVLLLVGCRFPWSPQYGMVTGIVRYPDQTPVYMAKVSIEGQATTFTDMLGGYNLKLRTPVEEVTVTARDGYTPGVAYAVSRSGSARVILRQSVEVKNLMLDKVSPI
jgi:hypothetical protein